VEKLAIIEISKITIAHIITAVILAKHTNENGIITLSFVI
jgi:hypothetical protein